MKGRAKWVCQESFPIPVFDLVRHSVRLIVFSNPAEEKSSGTTRTPEAAIRLRRALTLLPPDEREPIELVFLGGLSYYAVAKQLHLPERMVRSRIRRGLERLHSTYATPSRWQSRELIVSSNARTIAWRSSIKDVGIA